MESEAPDRAGTYESFAGAWPDAKGDRGQFNSMPKYVVSSTLEEPGGNNTTVSRETPSRTLEEQQESDGIMQVPGSLRLVQALLEGDLVEELHLMVFPVVLGTGRRLFGETSEKSDWRLVESGPVGPTECSFLIYERNRQSEKPRCRGWSPDR